MTISKWMMGHPNKNQGDIPMRTSLMAAAAAFSLIAQAASAHPTDLQATTSQTSYQWVDHTRAAQPGDYFAEASSWIDHTHAPQPSDYFADARSSPDYNSMPESISRGTEP